MFNAFARFDSQKAADNASQRILDTTNGITRIGTRKVVPSRRQMPNDHAADAIGTTVAHSAAMNDAEQSISRETVTEAATQEAEYDRRTGIEPPRKPYYILCAQGEKEAVQQAAKLMRDFGGSNVDVRDAKGDFLSGQPGIKAIPHNSKFDIAQSDFLSDDTKSGTNTLCIGEHFCEV